MKNISSVKIPLRVVKKEENFQIFNTKTFETIELDSLSMEIFNKIRVKEITNDKELESYAEDNNIEIEDCIGLVEFLSDNKYISIS
ncbi:MAG: hypothetical protein E7214_09700 [Clostridium sp.]|nr:hypothetical protein [Clostridium sp.]